MLNDFQLTARAEVFAHELYRNPKEPVLWFIEEQPVAPSWRKTLLLKIGNLLISLGTYVKNSAQPQTALSQEIL